MRMKTTHMNSWIPTSTSLMIKLFSYVISRRWFSVTLLWTMHKPNMWNSITSHTHTHTVYHFCVSHFTTALPLCIHIYCSMTDYDVYIKAVEFSDFLWTTQKSSYLHTYSYNTHFDKWRVWSMNDASCSCCLQTWLDGNSFDTGISQTYEDSNV